MPSCEKCWSEAAASIDKTDQYQQLIETCTCTPEEQAGRHAEVCPVCHRRTQHQHYGVCMNPECKEETP